MDAVETQRCQCLFGRPVYRHAADSLPDGGRGIRLLAVSLQPAAVRGTGMDHQPADHASGLLRQLPYRRLADEHPGTRSSHASLDPLGYRTHGRYPSGPGPGLGGNGYRPGDSMQCAGTPAMALAYFT